ncbi:MAG: hypothetical protein Q8Q39_00235 [bacterium]|nr:hypothetical protein [bacterium]
MFAKMLLTGAAILVGAVSLTGLKLKGNPDVLWQTQKLEVSVAQGGRASVDASFIVNTNLENVSLRVTPEIEPYVIVTPNHYSAITAQTAIKPQVIIAVPSDLAAGTYGGTLQIRAVNKGGNQERTFAKPLPITIIVTTPPPPPSADTFELINDDGTAEAFDFNHSFGRVASFAKFDVVGQVPLKIDSIKLYLRLTGEPASPIDIYVWDFERNRLIDPVSFTPAGTQEGWYTVDLSSYNLVVSDEFYLGVGWPELTTPALLGVDLSQPQGTSYVVILSDDTFIPVANSNMMIRAVVEKQ